MPLSGAEWTLYVASPTTFHIIRIFWILQAADALQTNFVSGQFRCLYLWEVCQYARVFSNLFVGVLVSMQVSGVTNSLVIQKI